MNTKTLAHYTGLIILALITGAVVYVVLSPAMGAPVKIALAAAYFTGSAFLAWRLFKEA